MDVLINYSNEVSKYKCIELRSNSLQYKFVKSFFYIINCESTNYATSKGTTQNLKVYRIIENNPVKKLNEKRNSLMLFHGTNKQGE